MISTGIVPFVFMHVQKYLIFIYRISQFLLLYRQFVLIYRSTSFGVALNTKTFLFPAMRTLRKLISISFPGNSCRPTALFSAHRRNVVEGFLIVDPNGVIPANCLYLDSIPIIGFRSSATPSASTGYPFHGM